MRVLIVGAGGFIGGNVAVEAANAGHDVIPCGRDVERLRLRFPGWNAVSCDLAVDTVEDWRRRIDGVDAVVNAAGIFQGAGKNSLEAVHIIGPRALFEACAELRVPKLVQISALGADEGAQSKFHLTKRAADEFCLILAERHGLPGWIVIRPSLVIGRGGKSTELFAALGALPWPPRLGRGTWQLQPVHVRDVALGVRLLLDSGSQLPSRLDIAGLRPMTTDQITHTMRRWLLLPPSKSFPVPEWLLRVCSPFARAFSFAALSRDSLDMLARGNKTSIQPLRDALGWQPRPLADALSLEPSDEADLWHARLYLLKPALRTGLALIWILTAIVSAFIYPVEKSAAMVAGIGVSPAEAAALVYGGAALDGLLGFALLLSRRPALIGLLQILTMAVFTLLATVTIPEAWIDPLGPLTKNLAVLLATLAMVAVEKKR